MTCKRDPVCTAGRGGDLLDRDGLRARSVDQYRLRISRQTMASAAMGAAAAVQREYQLRQLIRPSSLLPPETPARAALNASLEWPADKGGADARDPQTKVWLTNIERRLKLLSVSRDTSVPPSRAATREGPVGPVKAPPWSPGRAFHSVDACGTMPKPVQRCGAVLPEPTVDGAEMLAVVVGWKELST